MIRGIRVSDSARYLLEYTGCWMPVNCGCAQECGYFLRYNDTLSTNLDPACLALLSNCSWGIMAAESFADDDQRGY